METFVFHGTGGVTYLNCWLCKHILMYFFNFSFKMFIMQNVLGTIDSLLLHKFCTINFAYSVIQISNHDTRMYMSSMISSHIHYLSDSVLERLPWERVVVVSNPGKVILKIHDKGIYCEFEVEMGKLRLVVRFFITTRLCQKPESLLLRCKILLVDEYKMCNNKK